MKKKRILVGHIMLFCLEKFTIVMNDLFAIHEQLGIIHYQNGIVYEMRGIKSDMCMYYSLV